MYICVELTLFSVVVPVNTFNISIKPAVEVNVIDEELSVKILPFSVVLLLRVRFPF